MEVRIEIMDFVGCNAMHFCRCPRKLQKNVVPPPSSGSKRERKKSRKKTIIRRQGNKKIK
jgi:hypothetical protein